MKHQLPEMIPMQDMPAGAVIYMPIEYAGLGRLFIVKDGDDYKAIPEKPEITCSCRCKTKYYTKEDFPDYPWVSQPSYCMECGLALFIERVKTEEAQSKQPKGP